MSSFCWYHYESLLACLSPLSALFFFASSSVYSFYSLYFFLLTSLWQQQRKPLSCLSSSGKRWQHRFGLMDFVLWLDKCYQTQKYSHPPQKHIWSSNIFLLVTQVVIVRFLPWSFAFKWQNLLVLVFWQASSAWQILLRTSLSFMMLREMYTEPFDGCSIIYMFLLFANSQRLT